MKKVLHFLFSRIVIAVLSMLVQIALIAAMLVFFQEKFAWFYAVCTVCSVLVVLHIVNKNDNPAYKIAWIIPVLALPVFGTLFYLMFGRNRLSKQETQRTEAMLNRYLSSMSDIRSKSAELHDVAPDAALQAKYLEFAAGAPIYTQTETEFLPLGDVMFPRMLEQLEKAEKFIFLEYFIIEPGKLWDSMLEILERKASAGVDVRLMYDDFGCMFTLPDNYPLQMEAKGIQCCVFRRFVPELSGRFNNRDHRKICVIDGIVAFTGGMNLADEYINARIKFGHWLDCGVMLRGAAVWSFTAMFLTMWGGTRAVDEDFACFRPDPAALATVGEDGFVQPYADTPNDHETSGENAYLNMIQRAKRYVYICTPYLIIDNEMRIALTTAAKSGIDVRIITPGVADKRLVYALSRSYYESLLEAGVRIFEYTPGFCHAKTFVSDDVLAICGTINLDYRSLYLHHECAAWMYGSRAVLQMRDSYLEILKQCQEITLEWCKKTPLPPRLVRAVLRIFAPFM